jgi:hypothetical protein
MVGMVFPVFEPVQYKFSGARGQEVFERVQIASGTSLDASKSRASSWALAAQA